MDYEELTRHELEAEVAKHMQDWKNVYKPEGYIYYVGEYRGENRIIPSCLVQPHAFEDVKREIERRGWEWACAMLPKHGYEFAVFNEHIDAYIGVDDSEFRAGCIAFLRACEVAEKEE